MVTSSASAHRSALIIHDVPFFFAGFQICEQSFPMEHRPVIARRPCSPSSYAVKRGTPRGG
jgi:hypothetical protein